MEAHELEVFRRITGKLRDYVTAAGPIDDEDADELAAAELILANQPTKGGGE